MRPGGNIYYRSAFLRLFARFCGSGRWWSGASGQWSGVTGKAQQDHGAEGLDTAEAVGPSDEQADLRVHGLHAGVGQAERECVRDVDVALTDGAGEFDGSSKLSGAEVSAGSAGGDAACL